MFLLPIEYLHVTFLMSLLLLHPCPLFWECWEMGTGTGVAMALLTWGTFLQGLESPLKERGKLCIST